ncbi:lipoprotein [Sunxiuqinia sp. sy24]|uniref:lipoprotein n=1 Tax=Sunxiuqinia sp. sy24 TaxID=3461495 RepID=UPI0040459C33
MKKWILYISFAFILTACSIKPPDWIIGKWYNSTNPSEPEWIFTKDSVMNKQGTIKSEFFIDWTDKNLENKYVLQASHVLESEPHYEIFERISADTILYYISSDLKDEDAEKEKIKLIRK